jgi:hypothetical protein
MTAEETSGQLAMSQHPDIVALRERYERVSETPQAWLLEGLTLMAGVFVAMSPWVVGFQATARSLAVSDLIVGGALTLLALGFATFYERTHGLMWVAPIIGVWLIAAPWVVRGIHRTTAMNLSQIIVGACVVLLGLGLSMMVRFRTQH